MLKKFLCLVLLSSVLFFTSGCAVLVGAAVSGAAAYGISQAFK
jgi:hypothetical protein